LVFPFLINQGKFMKLLKLVSACLAVSAAAYVLPAQAAGTWETTLLGRDSNFNAVAATDASAVYLYDTTLDVTWLRNANVNGGMSWGTANTWASNLVTGSGANTFSDWRLPTMTDTGTLGCNYSYGGTDCGYNPSTATSEMASLFFNTLGNKSYVNTSGSPQAGYGLTNAGSFQNMQSSAYWLGTEYAPNTDDAWYFYTGIGQQGPGYKLNQFYALAVRSGDVGVVVSSVPEPETYAMMLAGLAMVGALSRRRSRAMRSLAL